MKVKGDFKMNFADVLKKEGQKTPTENGQLAYNTTDSALLDFFAIAGALRKREPNEIEEIFSRAFNANPLLATKLLFYTGDIRGLGLGERRTFKILLRWMAMKHPEIVKLNIELISKFNRWDSLFVLIDTPCEDAMWWMIKEQIIADYEQMEKGLPISLLAKWMPSENASAAQTAYNASVARKKLGLTPKVYRQLLSLFRSYLEVVEGKMSLKKWEEINYEKVPSLAMKKYQKAFQSRDTDRFMQYIEDVNSGEKKINASVLYPYDLVEQYLCNYTPKAAAAVIEAQWKALPNYISGENNILVMADVSDSMSGRPMATSIGLAIYFAERNHGPYKNLYMSFTDQPHFFSIKEGVSLKANVKYVENAGVGYGTSLEKAFEEILNMALKNNIAKEDMPEALIVVSDQEIDRVVKYEGFDFVEAMKKLFNFYGYNFPKLILWNVDSRKDTYLTQDKDVILVSGQSTNTFKTLLSGIHLTAEEMMLEVLNNELYSCIKVK